MLILKLFLIPAFLALTSMAGKRWGPGIAGWLAGFPIVAGPILLFLALEKGAVFAAQAATLSLSAVFASVTFSLAYSWTCLRHDWLLSVLLALAAWLAAALVLVQLPVSVFVAFSVALGTLIVAPSLFPKSSLPIKPSALPRQELLFRMTAGAMLTLAVTGLSSTIGASWSGLLAVFPILGFVLAVFSHSSNGPPFVVALLKAMASGLYSFIAFCLALALLLPGQSITASFVGATGIAALVQWASKTYLMRRLNRQH